MDDTDPPPVVHTDRQRELIRARLEAYHDLRKAIFKKTSWGGICDAIFDCTGVLVRKEVVRKWVRKFVENGRTKPVEPNAEELKAIVSALMHPDINMLSAKELNEPEIPYRFAQFLLDFLAHPGHNQRLPPQALGGLYRAYFQSTDGLIDRKVELTLQVHEGDHVIRVTEEAWSYLTDADPKTSVLSPPEPKMGTIYRASGWGVITPEDNLLIFMKDEHFFRNYYYLTIALFPSIWAQTSITQLALLRHAYPVPDESNDKSLEELMRDTDGDTVLLRFNRT